MDAIDENILRELAADARLPFRELGRRVGLSANAAAARVRRLTADGTIRGFTVSTGPGLGGSGLGGAGLGGAGLGAARRGPGLEVFIDVRLKPEVTYQDFAAARARFGEILDAVHLTGGYDYLVHAVVPDAGSLDRLVRRLKAEAGAAQTLTRLALRDPAG